MRPGICLALAIMLLTQACLCCAKEAGIADISAAFALLQAGKVEDAAKILQTLVAREPTNASAWRLLGSTYKAEKQWDKAGQAYRRALKLDPATVTPIYNLAAVSALLGKTDDAFAWLEKGKASRKVDFNALTQDKDFDRIRDDKRFANYLPSPKDFREPFVEPIRIIQEIDGEAANDQFGWIARKLGDVDGDGSPDFVTSAPTNSAGGENAGCVYVYSGRTGELVWKITGSREDQLGLGLEGAGDVNGDGVPDVVAGAPPHGVAYIYSGKDGRVLLTLRSSVAATESFGQHVAGAGDVNHDGPADILIGAPPPLASTPGKGLGHAYLYSGKDGDLLLTLAGEAEGDRFGSAVAGYSDDREMFLVVGAPKAGPMHKGRAHVYDSLSGKPKFVLEGDETAGAFGAMFLSIPGDVDGDGTPDIYVSDWQNNAKGPSTGRAYLYSGRDGHVLLTLTGEKMGEGFRTCAGLAGDVDADGHADLIIGAWQQSTGAMSAGKATLFSGKDGRRLKTYTCKTPGDTFGFDAVGLGDVDGDGVADLLITSAWSGMHGYHSGRLFVISSGLDR